jgi:hypothetical protein
MSSRRSRAHRAKNGHGKSGQSAESDAPPRNDVIDANAVPPLLATPESVMPPPLDELALVDAAWDELLV